MRKVLNFFKNQDKKPWYKQWWPYAVVVMYLLVVVKTMTFPKGEGWELQQYDGRIISISSQSDELMGTIGLKREGAFLQATYNLYITSQLKQNDVCYSCIENPAFDRPCRSIDRYNYVGQISGGGFSGKGLAGRVAPVFCDQFEKPENQVESNVSWTEAVCFSSQAGKDISTDKFYFNGAAIYNSYEELFELDKLEIFDSQRFTIKDSCHEGIPGSNFEQTEVEKVIELEENVKSYQLIFEDN